MDRGGALPSKLRLEARQIQDFKLVSMKTYEYLK